MPVLICLRKKLWTRTYSTRDQVPTCPVFTHAKIKPCFGIKVKFSCHNMYQLDLALDNLLDMQKIQPTNQPTDQSHTKTYEGHLINSRNFFKKSKINIFIRKFFHKWNWLKLVYLHYLELNYNKNYSNMTKISILKLFKMAANQTDCSWLNRVLWSSLWWLRTANHVKFTEISVICMEKHLVKIMLNMGLLLQT